MEGGFRGLVIVFSAFMIQVLAFGNYASVGIYTVHLLDVFDNNVVGVALISSIHFAVLLCCGPLASFLMTKVSYRKLCLLGASLVTIGLFCTPLLTYLPAMYIFFGVFAGLGGCLIYLPSHVLSGLYYDKHRSLSTGVATAGTGMGAVVMPLVVGLLIEEYTWKGSLIILAGIDMHLFIFALFMIPPPKESDHLKKNSKMPMVQADDTSDSLNTTVTEYQNTEPPDRNYKQSATSSLYDKVENNLLKHDSANGKLCNKEYENGNISHRENGVCLDIQYTETTPANCNNGRVSVSSNRGGPRFSTSVPDDDISWVFIPSYFAWSSRYSDQILGRHDAEAVAETAILDSTENLLSPRDDPDVETRSLVSESKDAAHNHISVREHLKKHLSILTNCKFIIYFISTIIWSMTVTMFITFGPELIVLKGHSPVDTAFVFTFYGVGQLVGCIIISIIGNFFGRRMLLYIVSNLLTGAFMVLVPLVDSFVEIAVMLVFNGLAYGGLLGLYMIVMVDLLGPDDMDIGLAYVLLASGLGCFAGPPLGGLLSQLHGGYDQSFYSAGVLSMFAGLIMLFVYLPRCQNNKQKA